MKQLQISFKTVLLLLCCMTSVAFGQKQSKTYTETFKVGDEAVLDINTSHADIEFETWSKNEVSIEAIITLEGASKEEAEVYFKSMPVKMIGNSSAIEISTGSKYSRDFSWSYPGDFDFDFDHDFDFVIPDISAIIHDATETLDVVVIPELPPMPPLPNFSFDYDKYEKEGDAYLDKWKDEFNENFDEKYKERLEEWGERVKERAKRIKERRVERDEARKVRDEARKVRAKVQKVEREKLRKLNRDKNIFRIKENGKGPNIYYYSSDGKDKNFKVKKVIKIKMPKSAKLKMNVRHGEVKLAENTKNINATLSYARLLGSTIDGNGTFIKASYTPVTIQNWKYGKLTTDYSDNIKLKEVRNLRLNSVSSAITIDRILNDVYLESNLGDVVIGQIANEFNGLHFAIKNGALNCQLPESAYNVFVTDENSKVQYPVYLTMNVDGGNATKFHVGYNKQKNEDRVIVIDSKYSKIVLE